MQTSLKTIVGLKKSLTVELAIDVFNQKTDKILQKMASATKIDGFRKGKVPMAILHKRFAANAKYEAANKLVSETLAGALAEAKINPVAQPTLSKIDTNNDKKFSYTIEFEVFPEVKLSNFSKLKISEIQFEITQKDEDETLANLMKQSTKYEAVERKSKNKDKLTIDFKGLIAGETFAGGDAQDFTLILGESRMIEGFEAGLINVSANETCELNLTFPKDYHANELAGKAVTFQVTIKAVAEPIELKLDDKLAQELGEKDTESLLKNIKQQMQTEADNYSNQQNKNSVFAALIAAHKFDVPSVSVENEAKILSQQTKAQMQEQGLPTKDELATDIFNDEAKKRVQLGLIVSKIASENKFSVSKQQINDKLAQMAQSYGKNGPQMIEYYNQDPARLAGIESLIMEQMAVDLVLQKAVITTTVKKFADRNQK